MSGLEVLGAVASVGQLIDLSLKVINRMRDFRNEANTLPKIFQSIEIQLPVFVEILRTTKAANDANRRSNIGSKALDRLIQRCYVQIDILNTLLEKMLPHSTDSGMVRGWKAVKSFRHDDDVKTAERVIRDCLETLSHQGIAAARTSDLPRMHTLFVVNIARGSKTEHASSWLVQHIWTFSGHCDPS